MNKLFTFFFYSFRFYCFLLVRPWIKHQEQFLPNTGNAIGSVAGLFIGESMGGRHGAF